MKIGELVRVGNDVGPLCTAFLTDKRKSCEILRQEVLKSGATIMDRIMITDLIQVDGKVCGAVGMSVSEGDFYIIHAITVDTNKTFMPILAWR